MINGKKKITEKYRLKIIVLNSQAIFLNDIAK